MTTLNTQQGQPQATPHSDHRRHVRFGGLTTKLVLTFTLVFSVVFALSYLWFFNFATNSAIEYTVENMRNTTAGIISGMDIEAFEALVNDIPGDGSTRPADERYWQHVNWLAQTKRFEPEAGIYTFVPGPGPDQVTYIGSAGAVPNPLLPADELADFVPGGVFFKEVGTNGERLRATSTNPLNLNANLQAIETGEVAVESTIYADNFGAFISVYEPFMNAAGEVVGVVGLDLDAVHVQTVQQAVVDRVFIAFAATYIGLFGLVTIAAFMLTYTMRRLSRAAEAIGDGRYDEGERLSNIKGPLWNDEIDLLADVLADIAQKVDLRETKLKQQVEELRIEIDEVKAKQQVDEIVESDFFATLTQKVSKIRQRKSATDETANPTSDKPDEAG